MYVGIRCHVADLAVQFTVGKSRAAIRQLAAIPTRLDAMKNAAKQLLVNWQYVILRYRSTGTHLRGGRRAGQLALPEFPFT
jgi:hypothetical protein